MDESGMPVRSRAIRRRSDAGPAEGGRGQGCRVAVRQLHEPVEYEGAIDDKRSARASDRAGAHNYVRAALNESLAGKPVTVASTAPYGCSVKY